MTSHGYTRESIERALDVHVAARRIRAWTRRTGYGHIVTLNEMGDISTRTLRESYALVCGLASASSPRANKRSDDTPASTTG